MSSSRVRMSLTGFLTILAITAACTGASGQMRRPKPPPSSCRLILILSGVVLSTPATTAAASGCTCERLGGVADLVPFLRLEIGIGALLGVVRFRLFRIERRGLRFRRVPGDLEGI